MAGPDTDPVAAYLAEVKRAASNPDAVVKRKPYLAAEAVAQYVPPLVAAVEAALELAAVWNMSAADLDGMAERAAARGAAGFRTEQLAAAAQRLRDCAEALESAVTAALRGERH